MGKGLVLSAETDGRSASWRIRDLELREMAFRGVMICQPLASDGDVFDVSAEGNDTWPGIISAANSLSSGRTVS